MVKNRGFLWIFALSCIVSGSGEESATGAPRPEATVLIIHGCPADHVLPCVPKCCDIYESYVTGNTCRRSPDYFLPEFADCPNTSDYYRSIPLEERYEYFIGDPCEREKYVLDVIEYPEDEHRIFSNGTLLYGRRLLGMDEFCVESVNGTPRVFVCFENQGDVGEVKFKFLLYPIGLLISIPLLIFTAVVYLGIEKLRDVQGKSLACHVICLAVAYLFLAMVQLASHELHSDLCTAAAFIIQFFFVACFFWLNVLSYDTWRNITNQPQNFSTRTTRSEAVKFVYYSLYAWYGPCVLTIVSLVMDLEPAIPESYLKPKFGFKSCWFQSDAAALPYFYAPVGVLILINLVFFVLSARKIYADEKSYVRLKMTSNQTLDSEIKRPPKLKMNIRALRRCVTLFCVMGINWAAEVISWVVGGSDVIWLVTDVFNTLQGLIIFYIFIIKPRCVRLEVLERFNACLASLCCRRRANNFGGGDEEETDEEERLAFTYPKEKNLRYIDASVNSLTNL